MQDVAKQFSVSDVWMAKIWKLRIPLPGRGYWAKKNADLEMRAKNHTEQVRALDTRIKQYEADVLRINRLQGALGLRPAPYLF